MRISDVPLVIQANKRDLPEALDLTMLKAVLDPQGKVPVYEAVAANFEGVFEPLRGVATMVLEKLAQRA
jgi:signal recognition particle receptor subunit beta